MYGDLQSSSDSYNFREFVLVSNSTGSSALQSRKEPRNVLEVTMVTHVEGCNKPKLKMISTVFESAQPYLIPGYTGYLPQYIFRVGETYGKTSHKIMLDPNINMAERLVLSDRTVDDSTVSRPNENDIDIVESRTKYGEVIFKHPVISGYEGGSEPGRNSRFATRRDQQRALSRVLPEENLLSTKQVAENTSLDGTIPGIRGKHGQSFCAEATVALSEFEKMRRRQREDRKQLEHYKTLQCDQGEPRELLDRLVQRNKWKMPLYLVRPEAQGIVRSISVPEAAVTNFDNAVSPYFSDPNHPEKYFKHGYTGHVPFGTARFGGTSRCMSNASLVDFTNNYRRRLSTEWAPVTAAAPDPPGVLMPPQIYHKHVGMIPHYMGHLPGAQFRCGKTFGNDTRDGKRWLRGDFS